MAAPRDQPETNQTDYELRMHHAAGIMEDRSALGCKETREKRRTSQVGPAPGHLAKFVVPLYRNAQCEMQCGGLPRQAWRCAIKCIIVAGLWRHARARPVRLRRSGADSLGRDLQLHGGQPLGASDPCQCPLGAGPGPKGANFQPETCDNAGRRKCTHAVVLRSLRCVLAFRNCSAHF